MAGPLFALSLLRMSSLKILLVTSLLGLLGCDEDRHTTLLDSIDEIPRNAIFDPSAGVIPFPNNLLFVGTTDGSLNIPVADANDPVDPAVAMNTLDGFSTTAPISTRFSTPIDAATIPGNVRMFAVTIDDFNLNPTGPPTFAVIGVTTELIFGVDFFVTVSSETSLVILPLKPLAAKSGYMVVVSNGLTDTSGVAYTADLTYALTKETTSLLNGDGSSATAALSDEQAQSLEPLRQLTNVAEIAVTSFDASLSRNEIILSWSFTTQSTADVLSIVRAAVPVTPTLGTFSSEDPASFGLSSEVTVYSGTIDVPYYLSSGVGAFSGSWTGVDGLHPSLLNAKTPVATEVLTIPLLVTLPSAASLNNSAIPTIIYQHGITSNRTTVLELAESMAAIGAAMVAIDLPLHGVSDSSQLYQMGNERTFDLDFVDNSNGLPVPGGDGTADPSGTHFINLSNLLISRDNVRQGVSDLFVLTQAVGSIDVNGGGPDLDSNNVSFLGHSLGAIVGVPFLALEPNVTAGVIAMGAGGIAKVLDGSADFGPRVAAGLAANGVIKGTADYEAFMLAAQTVLDSADPLNYGVAANNAHNILALEIVGDVASGGTSPSDLVIPNTVPDGNDSSGTVASPLAGTEPLIGLQVMALTQVDADDINTGGLDISIKYTAGGHSSIRDPAVSAAATDEIQLNVSSYLDTSGVGLGAGNQLTVSDTSVIQTPPSP